MDVPNDAADCSCAENIFQILRNADSSTVAIVEGTRNIAKFDLDQSQQDQYYAIVMKMLHSESCWISMAAIDGIEKLNDWTIEQRQSFLSVLKDVIAKKGNYQKILTKHAINAMKKLGVSAVMLEKELIANLSSAVIVAQIKGTIITADICIALNNTSLYLSYSACLQVVELLSLASLAKAVKLADRTMMQQALNDFLQSCSPSTCSLILLRLMRMLGDRKVLSSYAYITHIMATVKNNIHCVSASHIVQLLPHVIIFTDGSQFYTVCGIEHHDCGAFHTVTSQKHIPDVLCDEILSYLEVSGGLGSVSKSFCESAQHSACSLVSRLKTSQLSCYLDNIVLAQPNRSKLETMLYLADHLLPEIDTAHVFQLVVILLDRSFIILENITPSLQSRLLLKLMPVIPAQYYVECLGICLQHGDKIADDKQLKSAVQVTTDTIANRLLTSLRAEHITSITELLQLKLPVTVTSPIYAAFSLQYLLLVAEKYTEVELEPLITIAIALQDLVNHPKRQAFTGNLLTQLSEANVQKLVSYLLSTSRSNTKEMYVLYCLLNHISTDQFAELMQDLLLQYPLDKLRQTHMSLLANVVCQLSTAHLDILLTQFIPHLTAVCAIDIGEVTISEFLVLFELIAKLPVNLCIQALAILFQLACSIGFEHQFLGRALEKSMDMCASQSPEQLPPILLKYVDCSFDLARSKAFYGLQQFSGDVGTEYMEMMLRNLGTVQGDNNSPLRAYELQLNLNNSTESQRVRLFSILLARTVVKYSFKLVRTVEIVLLNVDEVGFYLPDIQCDELYCTLKYRDTVALSAYTVTPTVSISFPSTAISQPLYDMLVSHLRELVQPTAGSFRHSSKNVDGWKFHAHMGELEKFALNLFPFYPRDTDRFIVSALGDLVAFIPATMYGDVKLCLLTQWGKIIFARDIVLTVMNKIDAYFAQHHVEALVSGLEFVAQSFGQHCVSEAECKAVAQLAELVKAHPEINFGEALGRLVVIYRMRVAELERQKTRHTVQHASTLLGSITKAGGAYDLVKSIPTVFCFPDAADVAVTTMISKLSIKEWKIRANIIDAMSHLAPYLNKQKVDNLFSLMLETVDCNINRSRYSAARVLIRLSIYHHEYIDTMLVAVSSNWHENRPYYLIAVDCLSELWRDDNSVDKKTLINTHINSDTASTKVRNMLLSSLLHESLPLYVDLLSENCRQRILGLASDNLPVSDRFICKHFTKFPVQCAAFAIRLLCKIATTPNYKNRRNFAVQPLRDFLSKLPAVDELKLDFELGQLSVVQRLTTVSDNQLANEVQIRLLVVLLPYISNNHTVAMLKFLTSDKIDVVRRTFSDFVALVNAVCARITEDTVGLEAIISQLTTNMTGNSSRNCKYCAIQTIASLLRIKPQLRTPDILTSLLSFVHCRLDTVTTHFLPTHTNAVLIDVHKQSKEIIITYHREDSQCVTDKLSERLKKTLLLVNTAYVSGYYNNTIDLSQEHLTEIATLRTRSLVDSADKNVFHEQHIAAIQTAVSTIVQLLPQLPDQQFLSAFKIVFTSTVHIPLSSNNNVSVAVETVLSSIPETKVLHVIDFLVMRAERAKGSAAEKQQAVAWLRTLYSTRNAVVTRVIDGLLTRSEDEVLREFGCVVLKLMQCDVCI